MREADGVAGVRRLGGAAVKGPSAEVEALVEVKVPGADARAVINPSAMLLMTSWDGVAASAALLICFFV